MQRWIVLGLSSLLLISVLPACVLLENSDNIPTPSATGYTLPPTPSVDVLRISGTTPTGARLRVTVPSVELLNPPVDATPQLFVVLADPGGTYSYALAPANRAGISGSQFDLKDYPLEVSLNDDTSTIILWLLAVDNRRYEAAEQFGLDALAASLGFGFHNWLATGDPLDDPLAGVISASEGALYEWFASVDVLGQTMITLDEDGGWNTVLASRRSDDQGLSAVYTVSYIDEQTVAQYPTATPPADSPDYDLIVDETFDGATSEYSWYQGQDETYTNAIINGAYEIELSAIVQREFGLSWGSIDGAHFSDYVIEAEVELMEEDVKDARYGIWFNYQDDYNFVYFGVSNQGEYRAAVIVRNSNRIELQNWTQHPAIRRGAATNTLRIVSTPDGDITLSANGEQLAVFNDQTFTSGSIAFFCYAESVPTTCRLNELRIWERAD